MFELTPSIPQTVQTSTEMTVCINKPKTQPIPTATSNKYAIFTSDDEKDEEIGNKNDEVTTNEVYTTEMKPGSSNNNNKIRPDDIFDDEASQLTATTKNSYEDHYESNILHDMPPKNNDDDDNTLNEQPTPEARLGSVNNNNKDRNDNISDGEESQLSVATENLDDYHYALNVSHSLLPQNDDDETMNEP